MLSECFEGIVRLRDLRPEVLVVEAAETSTRAPVKASASGWAEPSRRVPGPKTIFQHVRPLVRLQHLLVVHALRRFTGRAFSYGMLI